MVRVPDRLRILGRILAARNRVWLQGFAASGPTIPMKSLRRLALVALVGIAALSATLAPASAQRRRTNRIKLGTVAPKNSVYHEVLLRLRQSWRDISGGGVDLTIYPGGVAGDEITMLRKMRAGQMQAALISGSGMSFLDEGVSALQVPLMFDSYEEFDFVRGKLAPILEQRLKDKGFTVLGWGDAGWAYFFSVRPFRTPNDVKAMKLYTAKGDDEMLRLFSEFGLRVVPLDLTELQASLETGLVEIFAVPPLVAAGYQWFASAPHMLDMRFLPIVGAVLIDNRSWDAIPDQQRSAMRRVAAEAAAEIQQSVRSQEQEAIAAMEGYGLNVVGIDEAAIAEWKREVERALPNLRDRYAPSELIDEALHWRDSYRAR